jgi:hypothetical protein
VGVEGEVMVREAPAVAVDGSNAMLAIDAGRACLLLPVGEETSTYM